MQLPKTNVIDFKHIYVQKFYDMV